MNKKLFLTAFLPAVALLANGASEVYVSPTGNDTTGDGTKGNPYLTIVKGVNSCDEGGTLTLLRGRHDLGYGETEIKKGIIVRGETDNPWDTVVNLNKSKGPAFALNSAKMLVYNIAVTNAGGSYAAGSAFKIVGNGGTVSNCVMWRCNSEGYYYGSAAYANSANALFTHCVISNCVMSGKYDKSAGGMILGNGSRAVKCLVANCSNTATEDDYSAGGVKCDKGYLTDCTIVGNTGKRTGGLTIKSGSAVNCVIAGNMSSYGGSAYADIHPADVGRVSSSASSKGTKLGDTCVLDHSVNLLRNLAAGDYRPPAISPYAYGYYPVDATEPKVTMKVDAVSGLAPLTVTFEAEVDGFQSQDEVTYAWNFGSGVSASTTSPKTTATFGIGTHDVTLTVVNATTGKTYVDTKKGLITVGPKDVYVRYGNKTPSSPFATENEAAAYLTDALNVAVDGTTVHLLDAKYEKGATISKAVTLVGNNANPENVLFYKAGLTFNAAGIALSGATFSNCGTSLFVSGYGCSISNCVVRNGGNSGPDIRSTIYVNGIDAIVTHCCITNNFSSPSYSPEWWSSGAMYINGGVLRESLVHNNRITTEATKAQAGGLVLAGGARMINCTVVGNYCNCKTTPVGGVSIPNGSVVNCIIAGNTVGDRGDPVNDNIYPSQISKCSSCVVTNVPDAFFENYAQGKFAPSGNALVFDAGSERLDAPAKDLAGNERIQGKAIDLGCYERDPNRFTVSVACSETEKLAPATFSLSANCDVPAGSEVTYTWYCKKGSKVVTYTATNDKNYSPELTECGTWDVYLYVTNKTSGLAADSPNPGFLSVQPKTVRVKLGNKDSAYPYDGENNAAGTLAEALTAVGNGSTIYLSADEYNESITVKKAIRIQGDDSRPENVRVTIPWVVSASDVVMSGITFTGFSSFMNISGARFTMTNCVVRNASSAAGYSYSPLRVSGAGALFTHCYFTNNSCGGTYYADYECPGALYLSGGSVRECLFWKNSSIGKSGHLQPGAATLLEGSSMINCTVADNQGSGLGGVKFKGSSTAVNTIIAGNSVTVSSADYANIDPADASRLSSSVVTNDTSIFEGFFEGQLGPSSSPLVYDAGAERADPPARDLAGNARIQGVAIDVGCFEREPNKFSVSFSVDSTGKVIPAVFALLADCTKEEGDVIEYRWQVSQDELVYDFVRTNDPSCSVALSESGKWDVSLAVSNLTAKVRATSSIANFLTTGPRTFYVKAGNPNAQAPYGTKDTAAAKISDAYAVTAVDGQEIVIMPGVYTNSRFTVTRGVSLCGESGAPEDVLVRGSGITLSHASSFIGNMVFEGQTFGSAGAGVTIEVNGGSVSNCVFRNMTGGTYYAIAPVYAEGPNALVTHCVISNNCPTIPSVGGASGAYLIGNARLENSLVAFNSADGASEGEGIATVSMGGATISHCTIVSNVAVHAGIYFHNYIGTDARKIVNSVIAGNGVMTGKSGYKTFNASYVNALATSAIDEKFIGVSHLIVGTPEEFFVTQRGTPFVPAYKGKLHNAANRAETRGTVDLLGKPRLFGRNPDIGCYENQYNLGLMLILK